MSRHTPPLTILYEPVTVSTFSLLQPARRFLLELYGRVANDIPDVLWLEGPGDDCHLTSKGIFPLADRPDCTGRTGLRWCQQANGRIFGALLGTQVDIASDGYRVCQEPPLELLEPQPMDGYYHVKDGGWRRSEPLYRFHQW